MLFDVNKIKVVKRNNEVADFDRIKIDVYIKNQKLQQWKHND